MRKHDTMRFRVAAFGINGSPYIVKAHSKKQALKEYIDWLTGPNGAILRPLYRRIVLTDHHLPHGEDVILDLTDVASV